MRIRHKLLIAGAVMVPVLGTGTLAYASTTGPAAGPTTPAVVTQTSESHGAPETTGAVESDGPGGHQDPAGSNVDHQFQGQE